MGKLLFTHILGGIFRRLSGVGTEWQNGAVVEEGIAALYPEDPNETETLYAVSNIIQGTNRPMDAFSADPMFLDLDDPDGEDDKWFTEDDGLQLLQSSPAIDAGYNFSISNDFSDRDDDGNVSEKSDFDILGSPRLIGRFVDIGPYESMYLKEIDENKSAVFKWNNADNDKDGLKNFDERILYRTNFDSNDTDNDGLLDNEEVQIGTNPNSPNTGLKQFLDSKIKDVEKVFAEGKQFVLRNLTDHNLFTKEQYENALQLVDTNVTPYTPDWFYMPDHGWMWSAKDTYPYFYDANSSNWMYFQSGHENPRFYHYGTKE